MAPCVHAQHGRLPVALMALFVLAPCQGAAPQALSGQASGSPAGLLTSAQSWKDFKAFWEHLDRNAGPMTYLHRTLAQRFGMQETALQEALRRTEQRATGVPVDAPAPLALGDYALASLAWFRIDVSTFEETPVMTRMMVSPPSTHVARQFQEMETVDQQVEQLRDLMERHLLDAETIMATLDGLRMQVYRYSVLRAAALSHRRLHAAPEQTATSGELALLSAFYDHPEKSAVGGPAWFLRYEAAALRMAKGIPDPKLRGILEQRHRALAASLKHLDAFKPRLETLFTELEAPEAP